LAFDFEIKSAVERPAKPLAKPILNSLSPESSGHHLHARRG
jgi:hypothetical protein